MGDLGEGAAAYVRGGFTLLVGNLVSYVILAVGSILVARMLTPAEYGLYAVCMVLPQFFLLFSDWGVNSALTRFLSRYRSEGRHSEIWGLNWVGLVFKLVVSGLLCLMLVFSADFLSVVVLKRPGIGDLIRIGSVFVIFNSLYATVVAILTGLERMDLVAVVHVSEALVKGIAAPALVYIGFGVLGSVIGYVSSYIVASILGVLLVVFSSSGSKKKKNGVVKLSFGGLSLMLNYGKPLFVGGLIAGLAARLQGFLLSWFVSDVQYGNYHVATNFSSLVSLLTGSIAVTLFPAFSKLSVFTEFEKTREAFMSSVRYSSIIVIPVVSLFVAVSEPMVSFLYTTRYPDAPFFMSLLLVPMLLVGFGSISIGNFLNSQGDTTTSFRVGLVSSAVSIALSPILVWVWGVFGLLLSIIASSFMGNILGVYVLHRKYGFYANVRHATRLLICSSLSAGISYGVLQFIRSPPILGLLVGSFVFLVLFSFLAPLFSALDERDVSNLGSMLGGIRVVSVFSKPLLDMERWIIRLLDSKRIRIFKD